MKKYLHAFLFILLSAYASHGQVFNNTYTTSDVAANKGTGKFTFYSFALNAEVAVEDSATTKWDIAFSGTTVIFNSGTKGPSIVAAQYVSPSTFEAITEAPASGYTLNILSGSGSWYNYYPGADFSGPHTILPIDGKMIVAKLASGRFVKLQILNYYQGAPSDVPTTGAPYTGVGKYYSFKYTLSDVTTGFNNTYTTYDLAATRGTNKFTFFNFTTGQEIAVTDSATANWDIAFSGTTVIFNGGTKGPGTVAAQYVTPSTFDAITKAPETGYTLNILSGSGSWYTYYPGADFSGPHTILPIDGKMIVAKLANRRYVKLQILNYYQGAPSDVPTTGAPYAGVGKYYSFKYEISNASAELNTTYTASDFAANKGTGKFSFFNFTTGDEVAVEDSATTKWDIAFSGTTVIFNGGLKGPGSIAAQYVTSTYDAITEVPAAGYTLNMLSGSGSWYNYYPGTSNSGPHTIVPIENKIIVAKLTDNKYVKVQILSYYQGAPTDVPTTGAPYTGIGKYYAFRYTLMDAVAEETTTGVLTAAAKTISIYPNPISTTAADLTIGSDMHTGTVKIMDLVGNQVYTSAVTNSDMQLTNLNLAQGIYLVVLESEGMLYQQKLVVK